ncbi:MAG: DUF6923 family protein [Fimbriimonas sp.]
MKRIAVACIATALASLGRGQVIYASGWSQNGGGGNSALYKVGSPTTDPVVNFVGQMGLPVTDIAINSSGEGFVATDDELPDRLQRVDLSTGSLTPIAGFSYNGQNVSEINALGFDVQDRLWASRYSHKDLYLVDQLSGTLTLMGTATKNLSGDLAASPDGRSLFISAEDASLVRFDLITQSFTYFAPSGAPTLFGGLAFQGGQLFGTDAVDNGVASPTLYRIDLLTGGASAIGTIRNSQGLGGNGLASAVPEPTSAVALGLFSAAALVRRRRRQARRPTLP